MLRWRLLLGPLLILALAGICWLDLRASVLGSWLSPLSLVAGLLASGEIVWLLSEQPARPRSWIVYVGNLAIVASSWAPLMLGRWSYAPAWAVLAWPLATFVVCLIIALLVEVLDYREPGVITQRVGLTLFALAYVGLLLSCMVALRSLGSGPIGIVALAALVIVVKLGDIGAYTVGRLIGRHKLAPRLSPGKTIEGAFGAMVFACLGAWLALVWLPAQIIQSAGRPAESWGWVGFGLIVGIAGLVGDLAESLLKRDVGRKDSSAWLPGFGGVLDVIDSMLFAAPVAYLCWLAGVGSP